MRLRVRSGEHRKIGQRGERDVHPKRSRSAAVTRDARAKVLRQVLRRDQPTVVGDGRHSVIWLVEKANRLAPHDHEVAGHALAEAEPVEEPEGGGHPLLDVGSLLLDGGDVNTGVPESDLQDAVPDFKGIDFFPHGTRLNFMK